MDLWRRLEEALALSHDAGARERDARTARGVTLDGPADVSGGGRVGAVLALLHAAGGREDDVELVLIRRRDDLPHHPGQVAFPGGRVDPGEDVEQAALREATEEVALDAATVTVLGRLPTFYIPPSRFWLATVVARWDAPHPLVPAEAEVAEILRVRLAQLRDPATWRVVRVSGGRVSSGLGSYLWAWQLDERHLLWGASAVVTAGLLDIVDPDWHGGTDPSGLAPEREVRPWDEPGYAGRLPPALVPGVPALRLADVAAAEPGRPVPARSGREVHDAGQVVAGVVERVLGEEQGPIAVLAGPAATGAVGVAAARALADAGRQVRVVLAVPPEEVGDLVRDQLDGLPFPAEVFDGDLGHAVLAVDALVGAGLAGPLRPPLRDVVLALRHRTWPVVAVDLPSGVDPVEGLVGEAVSADCTVALGRPQPALRRANLAPYVGDLYLTSFVGSHVESHVEPGAAGLDGLTDLALVRLVR